MANKKKNTSGRGKSSSSRKRGGSAVKVSAKQKKTLIGILAVIVLVVIIAAIIIYFAFPSLFSLFKKIEDAYLSYTKLYYEDSTDDDPDGTLARTNAPVDVADKTAIVQSGFSIHFLELGNKYAGDCTLIKCGDNELLIDAGSRKNSSTAIKTYVDQYCTDNTLEYVIATHAHQDHIAGFVGSGSGNNKDGILYTYDIGTIIQFSGHNTKSGIYNSYVSAVSYAESKGAVAYTALDCWKERGKKSTQTNAADTRSARREYILSEGVEGFDGTLTLNILYNYYYEHETADENDYSVCVLLTHTAASGKVSNYLFTGDLEGDGESKLVDNNTLPEVELFKGAHHGSKTSSTDKLLKVIKPKNVAVCCCAGATEYTSNKDNTFPTQDFINRISNYTENVYCTSVCYDYKAGTFGSMNGDIVFFYDVQDKMLKLWCSNNTTKLKDTEWFALNRTANGTRWAASNR